MPSVRQLLAAVLVMCGPALAAGSDAERLDRQIEELVSARASLDVAGAWKLLNEARTAGEERHVRALENALIADGIEAARSARALPANDAGRPDLLARAAAQLALAQPDHKLALAQRGYVRGQMGDLAGSLKDLAAVVDLDRWDHAVRVDLARARWRMGDRDIAVQLMDDGLRLSGERQHAELFVRMLRALAKAGEEARALELANTHVLLAHGPDVASAFHVYVAEAKIAARDLAGAMTSYLATQVSDRTWLVGGLVRAGRELGETEKGRAEVLSVIERLPRDATSMPASALRMAGDLRAAAGQSEAAVRHYAAALTGGDEEAREAIGRVQDAIPAYAKPGSVVDMMARPETVVAPLAAAPFLVVRPDETDATTGERLWPHLRLQTADQSVDRVLGLLPAPASRTPEAIERAVRELTVGTHRPVSPTRARLITEVLAGKTDDARSTLDALALTSWQVNNPRPLGFMRTALPATSSVSVEPVTQPNARPASVDAVAQALRELNDERSTERARLTRIMEVARQDAEAPLQAKDPIAIDCDASGNIEMTAADDEDRAVRFDLDGWGRTARIQWLAGRDGWLCEDADQDGKITSGRELFGTAGGFSDGFEKLARRDANHDGVVSGAELAGLSIWIDAENPGVTDPGELTPVEVAGLTAVTIPRVGLRAAATLQGEKRLCLEVWPEAFQERFASW